MDETRNSEYSVFCCAVLMDRVGEERLGDMKRIECDIQVGLQAAC